jgi:hypothetical protein
MPAAVSKTILVVVFKDKHPYKFFNVSPDNNFQSVIDKLKTTLESSEFRDVKCQNRDIKHPNLMFSDYGDYDAVDFPCLEFQLG